MKRSVYFPHTIVDGFFDDPYVVRRLALEQQYYNDIKYEWPGKRTVNLCDSHPDFFYRTITKISSLFYHRGGSYNYQAEGYFQLVDKNYGSGWVHSDIPRAMTAIFYLSPEGNQGTSLYSIKDPLMNSNVIVNLNNDKRTSIKNFGSAPESCEINNSFFEENLNVKGLFNRMFLFDSFHWHAAHNFFGEGEDSSRLTLVVFFDFFTSTVDLPIQRMVVNNDGSGF